MIINTLVTKEQQLAQGYFQQGTGPEEILIVGSCRTIAFTSYLVRWNDTIGNNRFTIRRIDPCDWVFSGIALDTFETNERMLNVLKGTQIFIHEHLTNYGMFNTDLQADKTIYDFGVGDDIRPGCDISIPNWNDHMILENDWTAYSAVTPDDYIERGEAEVVKFCHFCSKTSFPEFCDIFKDTWRSIRYFWRPNHTSAEFTIAIFRMMNDKILNLETNGDFWAGASQEDLFRDPHTLVTDRDRKGYGLKW